jgi:hypothetical protein
MPTNGGSAKWMGWCVLLASLALYGYYQGHRAYVTMHGNDFRHIYLGSVFLRHHMDPYDENEFLRQRGPYFGNLGINPYVYPPTTGLVLRFLTAWEWTTAARVWFFLNQIMLLAALLLATYMFLGFRDPWPLALVVLLAATSFPLRRTYTSGQLNCILLLVYCILCWAILARRHWLVGLMVGFGALFKLVPGILVVYFLWKRRWRELAWSVGCFAVILAISIAAAGWKVHLAYWPVMRAMGYGKSVWEERLIRDGAEPFYRDPYNQSLNSLFHHVLAPDPVNRPDPTESVQPWLRLGDTGPKLANGLTVLASLGLVLLALRAIGFQKRNCTDDGPGHPPRESLEISLMIMLSLLLPSILWDHYMIALFLPQIILLADLVDSGQWRSWRMAALLGASALLAWPIAFAQPAFSHGIGILWMSAKLYGVLILLALTLGRFLRGSRLSSPRGTS